MSSDDLEHSDIIDDDGTALAPAVFARDAEDAERYCELLADHDILGIVAIDVDNDATEFKDVTQGVGMTRGVAVLVEEALLDEASLVIADREDQDEFQFDTDDDDDDEPLDERIAETYG